MIARAGIMVAGAAGGRRRRAAVRAQDRIHLHTNETEIGEVLRDGGVCDRRSARGVRRGAEESAGARAGLSDRELFLFPLHPERHGLRRQHPARRRRPRPGQGEFRLQRAADRLECRSEKPSRRAGSGAGRHRREGRAADLSRHARRPGPSSSRSTICPRSSRRPARCGRTRHSSGRSSTNPASASFCVFNSRLKIFHFVLDETAPVADQFAAPKGERARS